jgi:hypothetical protein
MGQFTDAKVGPLSIAQVLILIGAIIGIISVFLTWWSFDWIIQTTSYSGWDFAFNGNINTGDFQKYCPLIAWIFAIIAIIAAALPMIAADKIQPKVAGIITLICGLLMIIFSVVWGTWAVGGGDNMFKNAQYGVWLMIVGGVVILIGGILPMLDKQ